MSVGSLLDTSPRLPFGLASKNIYKYTFIFPKQRTLPPPFTPTTLPFVRILFFFATLGSLFLKTHTHTAHTTHHHRHPTTRRSKGRSPQKMSAPGEAPQVRARKGYRQVKGGGGDLRMEQQIFRTRQQMALAQLEQREAAKLGDELELEGDIVDTSRNHLGAGFRASFMLVMIAIICTMMFIKFQGELIEPPTRDDAEKEEMERQTDEATEKYFEMIGKTRAAKEARESKQEAAIRKKQELREAAEAKEAAENKLADRSCDAACRASAIAIRDLGNQVSSTVVTDYYDVLDIKAGLGRSGTAELKEKFKKIKEKVERGDEDVKHLDLEEVQEAYGVLMNNEVCWGAKSGGGGGKSFIFVENILFFVSKKPHPRDMQARQFYNMYGLRPPTYMKAFAGVATHGGIGVEILSGSWKVKKLLAWMEQIDSPYFTNFVLLFIAFTTIMPFAHNFRNVLRSMKHAMPSIDPDTMDQREAHFQEVCEETLSQKNEEEEEEK